MIVELNAPQVYDEAHEQRVGIVQLSPPAHRARRGDAAAAGRRRLRAAAVAGSQLAAEDPKDVQSSLRLSQLFRQQKKYGQAREWSKKAKEIEPASIEVRYNDKRYAVLTITKYTLSKK